ncbi:hypothetical protein ACO22_03002 [Paracoccidioides brasiliensis]|uniref:Glycoside hydrolase family 31 TIM barrel domain-containing protein n=1 Tax=Paracoccidioides brasiliensis TaxID=121759 RepID=A0A1D2JH58_PARBR|nr:hypothetical protein ACO22_03002 [Paracoccidioides brasiliensis]
MNEVSPLCVGNCGSGNLALHPVHPPFPLPGEPGNVSYYYPEDFDFTNATETASASIASLRQGASKTSKNSSLTTTMSHEYLRTTPTPGFRNINHPPYVTNHVPGDLAVHAESPDATHSDGVVEYDIHNLYRHHLLNVTYHGSGAGHWGKRQPVPPDLYVYSMPQALSFSLYGIPIFGVDACGFSGNSNEELL